MKQLDHAIDQLVLEVKIAARKFDSFVKMLLTQELLVVEFGALGFSVAD